MSRQAPELSIETTDRLELVDQLSEELAGVALRHFGDVLGGALGDDAPSPAAAFGSQIDDPVGRLDDIEVVLDHDHCVAGIDQALENLEKLANVFEMEARGGLVEDVEGPPGRTLAEFGSKLDPLRLAT